MIIRFRTATQEDLPLIVAIYNSTVAGRMVTADTTPVTVESRQPWFEKHDARRPLWMVEDEQQEIVGWVSIQSFYGRPAYNGTVEISIYLHADHRGKGWGKAVLQHAIEACRNIGIKTVLGFIFAHNTPSLRLFHQAGFENWATLPDVALLDDTERSLIIVGKRIAP